MMQVIIDEENLVLQSPMLVVEGCKLMEGDSIF